MDCNVSDEATTVSESFHSSSKLLLSVCTAHGVGEKSSGGEL